MPGGYQDRDSYAEGESAPYLSASEINGGRTLNPDRKTKTMQITIRRRRVLHLVSNLGIGGIQVQLQQLLSRFSPEFDHQVLTLFHRGALTKKLESRGIRTTHCELASASRKDVAAKTRAAIETLKPDIVHAHGRVIAQIGVLAALRAGISLRIGHYYAPTPDWNSDLNFMNRITRTFERSSVSLFCSESVRAGFMMSRPYLAGVASGVTPCGIDLESATPGFSRAETTTGPGAQSGVPVIGTLSRIVPIKNHPLLIDAAALLQAAGYDFRIRIIGLGDFEHIQRLKEQIHRRNLASKIRFTGYVRDAAKAFASMDIFVLCSEKEGMPISIMEAWARGVPLVGTRVPGIEDFVHDGIDGLLCSPGDPKSLAETLERLLTDPELRLRLGRGGLDTVSRFTVAKTAEKMESIYHDLFSREAYPQWRTHAGVN